MIRYSRQFNDFRHWLYGLSELLQKPSCSRLLTLPAHLGAGTLYAPHLPEDISGIVMNFTLRDDLTFSHPESTDPPGLYLFFDQAKPGDRGAAQICSTARAKELSWPRGTTVKRVALLLPPSFLQSRIRKNILQDIFLYTSRNHKDPLLFEHRQLLDEIFNIDLSSPLHYLQMQNRLLMLVEKYLYTLLSRSNFPLPDPTAWTRGKEKDLEALKNIVQILSNTNHHKFPSVESLSKIAMMSSTKLKNRFKQIYGMKLYEFYNRHRLEQAKEQLKTGKFSVKQVGVNIGFSNLSNFAKAFKKEFGILPKDVLRNKQ